MRPMLSERARKLLAEAVLLPADERAELSDEIQRSLAEDDTQVDAETARRIEDALATQGPPSRPALA